jgi:hypothetical protein
MKRAGNREWEMGNRKSHGVARCNMAPIDCRSEPKPVSRSGASMALYSLFPIPDSRPL